MKKQIDTGFVLLLLLSIAVGGFYFFFVNLSTDTIILFLAQKMFLGKWIARGIVPFFNPHIFAGVPYLFDPGMGHLHPFNLFFLLPYPYSFSLWVFAATLLFVLGFYFFFLKSGSNKTVSILFTLILFFSGSGFIRLNNPTIYGVIAHYGIFLLALAQLKSKKGGYGWSLLAGILMTLSGHLQFVVYGYLLGFIIALVHWKVPLRKIILFFFLLGLSVSWYFVLSLPLVLSSTRIGAGDGYAGIGPIAPLQLLELVFPFFLGYVRNGSSWNAGPTAVLLISLLAVFLFAGNVVRGKIGKVYLWILAGLFVLSLGVVPIPFFRGAGQIWIMIHILALTALAGVKDVYGFVLSPKLKPYYLALALAGVLLCLFFATPVFPLLFAKGYAVLKHGAVNLFWDHKTTGAVGQLVGMSFLLVAIFALSLYAAYRTKKSPLALILFVVFEGFAVNFFHGYFIPASVLAPVPRSVLAHVTGFRIQSSPDVIPYTGFHTYMGALLFRPPFSKEKPMIDAQEEKTYLKLRETLSFYPGSWVMTGGLNGIQGYNTFVPKKIAALFTPVSADYKTEYAYIIARNSTFTDTSKISHINALDTSRVTLNDPRWQELGVRYFISDRPLPKYNLIAKDSGRLFYENPATLPIYRLESGKTVAAKTPAYQDPNEMVFDLKKEDTGKTLVVIINPDGFEAALNGKPVPLQKNGFRLEIPVTSPGRLKVFYSPLLHLRETLQAALKRS